ncbi:tetratricopeptide repeat protein [Streptomyces sp. VRA16 Mangrove soil]|uniref:ATP-binding protein n=1 Tax=Streptomyces sp. VRA16 Mangrove soil TaxID=2817434 RepID=UPI001A9FF28E|nr:helix-turn-helix domain-containing protein [Streptomyces sp. VRA16 Mangrove soil]MBO1330005.1 tetratricopeptide repeat protein [Streptomyces sp. VRA16 Mangrove soil]
MDKSTFGLLLREARQRSLLTLEGLAEASGVSVRAISDMERGKSLPRQNTLGELLDALGLDEEARRRFVQRATAPAGAPRTGAPRQLPPDLVVFRGRTDALTAARGVTDQVAADGGHVVVCAIGGMAGVGKTALAVHWAHQVADRFPDGQLYVNLRGFDPSGPPLDPGEALGGFLRALGVPSSDLPAGTEERAALFRQRTAALRLVVVLDNAGDSAQVRPLLPASAGSLTLVTSRDQLSGLAAVEGAAMFRLDVWTPAEARAALEARIGEERCRAEPEAVAELAELCGNLPLAIAVVGAQLSAEPKMRLALGVRELRQTRPRLDALSTDDRRVDVRAVFSWSYRALTPDTARLFRHLSVHPGPTVSAEAAASLAGVPLPVARRHLRELTAASLLSRDADGRYVLHDLVREYARELLAQERDDAPAARARLLDYLSHNAHRANEFVAHLVPEPDVPPVDGVVEVALDNRAEALDWFRQEESTVGAAARATDDPRLLEHRVRLTLEWVSHNVTSGRWSEETEMARLGLDAALALDDGVSVGKIRSVLARSLIETGRVAEADEVIDLMLAQLAELPPDTRARLEREIGFFRIREGRFDEALRHARTNLALHREAGRLDGIASGLSNVGWVLAHLGAYQEAIDTCEEAIPLLREVGDLRFEAGAWQGIGYARQGLGDLDAAVAGYERSRALFAELLDDYSQAGVLDHLATVQVESGDTERARENWMRAAELLDTLRTVAAAEMRAKARALPRPVDRPGGGEPEEADREGHR